MSPPKRYKQLRFCLESNAHHYPNLPLCFTLRGQLVQGILHGDSADWYFISDSDAFLKMAPAGILRKYMLWVNEVPQNIGLLYNTIAKPPKPPDIPCRIGKKFYRAYV